MKNKKIIFNLTIDDLKELGIIKKRRRRQRKIKYINGIPTNIRSTSNQMAGYTNEFQKTDNLKTENLRLQNDVLTQYPQAIKLQSGYEDRFNNIDEQYNNSRTIYENILAQSYRPRIQNNNLDDDDDTLSSDTRVERLSSRYGDPDDDIDVPQTGGSDGWQGYDNIIDPPIVSTPTPIVSTPTPTEQTQNEPPQNIPQNTPQTQQAGIRSPPNSIIDFRSTKSDDESSVDINNIVNSSVGDGYGNYQFAEEEDEKKSYSPNNPEVNAQQDEKKSDSPNNPEVNTQQDSTPEEEQYAPLTEENLEIHTGTKEPNEQPALTKNQLKYQKSQAVIAQAKKEYIMAGGKDSSILASSNRNLGSIRAATILLQNKSTKKNGKKNKK